MDHTRSSSNHHQHQTVPLPLTTGNVTASRGIMKQGALPNRYIFEFNGQKIYEWEQSLDEVTIYIDAPPMKASDFEIKIQTNRLQVGLKGHDRFFIDEKTWGKVDTSESSWYLDESILNIILIKVARGSVWEAPLLGQEGNEENGSDTAATTILVDPSTKEKITQELMLQRFQEENPGFDFRDAQFNGQAPDPRTFMGGIKYK